MAKLPPGDVSVFTNNNVQVKIYKLTATNIAEDNKGAWAVGGKVDFIDQGSYEAMNSKYGLNGYLEVPQDQVDSFPKGAVATDNDIKNGLYQTFDNMDPTGQANQYLEKNIDSIVKQVKQSMQGGIDNLKAYGNVWNQYKGSPQYVESGADISQKDTLSAAGIPKTTSGATEPIDAKKYLLEKNGKYTVVTKSSMGGFLKAGYKQIQGVLDDVPVGVPPQGLLDQILTGAQSASASPSGAVQLDPQFKPNENPFTGEIVDPALAKQFQEDYLASLGKKSQPQAQQQPAQQQTQQQTQQQKSGLPDEIAVGAALTGEEFDFETFKDLPEKIKNSKGWEALTDEQKVLAYFTYKTQTITNDAAKIDAEKALDEAMKLADPFYKEQIKLAKEGITQSIQSIEFSSQSKLDQYQKNIKDLEETLAFQKENLSLEEQQELSQQLLQNKKQLFGLQQNMAEAGLAFSSPYQEAESDLLASQQWYAQSTKQQFAKAKKAAEMQVGQNVAVLQQGISQTEQAKQMALKELGLSTESQVGTQNLPSIPGYTPLGDITGSIEEQKQSKILNLQEILKQSKTLNLQEKILK